MPRTCPLPEPRSGRPQVPLRQRPSLADLQLTAAQQDQGLSVIRALPLDFGDR